MPQVRKKHTGLRLLLWLAVISRTSFLTATFSKPPGRADNSLEQKKNQVVCEFLVLPGKVRPVIRKRKGAHTSRAARGHDYHFCWPGWPASVLRRRQE